MALFGSSRDVSLIKSLNRELINRFIDIEVALYKLNLQITGQNIYGESNNKTYYQPVRLHSLVSREDRTIVGDDFGLDTARTSIFSFFKPDLEARNIFVDVGDIIEHDRSMYQVDNITYAQEYFAGRDEATDLGYVLNERGSYGLDLSIVVEAHITRHTSLNIEPVRSGLNRPSQLPRNL